MAKDLGIKIKVDFPDAGKIQADFEKKIGKDGLEAKIKFNVDESSIGSLKSKINSVLGKEKFDIKLNLKTKEALEALSTFEKQFKSLKGDLEKSFDFKPGKGLSESKDIMSDVTKNGQLAGKAVIEANKEISKMSEGAERTGSSFDKLARTQAKSAETVAKQEAAMDSIKKKADGISESEQRNLKSSADKMKQLREIAGVMKEINALEIKGMGADSGTKSAIENRVRSLKDMLGTLQKDYQKTFNEDHTDESMIKNIKSIGEYNKELKKVAIQKENQKNIDRDQADRFRDLLSMENERYKLLKKSDNAGKQESETLRSQAAEIQKQAKFYDQQHNIIQQANVGQLRKLNLLAQESEMVRQVSAAKKADKGVDKSYKELKADLKQIYSLHGQISDLMAKQNAGVMNAKEENKLNTLREELKIREQMYNSSKLRAIDDGKMTSASEKGLRNAEREYQARNKISQEISKANAQSAKSDALYSQAAAKIQRISSLTEKMSGASRNESVAIKGVIAAEEAKLSAIMDSIRAQGLLNNAAEEEIGIRRQAANEELKAAQAINDGRQLDDDLSQFSMQQMFNPRQVASTARQAFQEIYESVRVVDDKLVDIAKVADVPTEVLDQFGKDVYGFASKFGVSADGYAEAVGRWVTTGKTLSESIELANASVMGSFVGNIGEEEMVKYMAVPLNAWKSEMLEANDVINAMNEVSNNNAIEMNDLGSAYERAASTAAQAGTSFSELTGMITGAQEATRAGGEKIGTAMKAIDVNFGKIASKIEKGDVKKNNFFKQIGVDINDINTGELRSTYDILNDLSKVWGDLNATDKSTAGMYAAGKNHSSIFSGMLDNWGTVIKATGEAREQVALLDKESGSAFQEFAVQQDSVEFKANNLKNTWSEFLSTISGGKDGVNEVLAKVSDVIKVGTKLAENPSIRKLGKGFLQVTAIMTATTAVSQFFKVISGGTIAALSGMKGLTMSFTKAGRAARAAAKANAASNAASAASSVGSTATAGMAAGALKATSAFGRMIPVIGGVISVLGILDAMGVPVWSTMGKMIDKVINQTSKAEKSLKAYNKEQEKTNIELQENKVLNGQIAKFNTGVKSYKDLRASKEKAFNETGDRNNLTYSGEEFETIKKQFNAMSEELGFDLKISWNNYDHIEQQFNKLISLKNALNADEASKLGESLGKKSKYEGFDGKWKDHEKILSANKSNKTYAESIIGDSTQSAETIKNAKSLLETVSQFEKYNGNFFNSGDMAKSEKANKKRIEDLMKTRKQLSEAAQAGTLQEGWGSMAEDSQRGTLALLSSELPMLTKKKTTIEAIQNKIKEGQDLLPNEQKMLTQLNKDYSSLNEKSASWGEDQRNSLLGFLEDVKKTTNSTSADLENSIRQLGEATGMTKEEINGLVESSKKGGADLVNSMSEFGEFGASILGVTSKIMAAYGEEWPAAVKTLQDQIDLIPEDKTTKYNLVQENGVANFDAIDEVMSLPDTIIKEFKLIDDSNNIQVGNVVEMLEKANSMPPEILKEIGIEVGKNGQVDLQEVVDAWYDLETADDRKEFMANFLADNEELKQKVEESKTKTDEVNNAKGTAKHDADNSEANSKVEDTKAKTKELDTTTGTVTAKGDVTDADTKLTGVYNKAREGATGTVKITGWVDSVVEWFRNLGSGSTKTVSVNVKGNKTKSVSSALNPNIGKSMSLSVGSALTGESKSKSSKGGGNPRYSQAAKDNQRVDEDVWRYWAKELFKGTPLERSMDNLSNSIKMAGEDQSKLISLYKQQIALLDKQIAYNNEMKNAKQQELNSVMAELRKQGFKTSGNQVTNLGHSKSFKGEKASEVNETLRRYKDLYQSIDQLNGTINNLNMSKFDAREDIKKAEIEKELKEIEKSLKRQEALLTSIRNRSELMATKESLVSNSDVELKLSVSEEGLNTSIKNIEALTGEFNRLSQSQVKHSENAEQVRDSLSELKSEILSNADAILEYREAMNDMKISRFINDYQKFTDVISGNIERLNSNIEQLKSGLVDGSKYGDLISSSLDTVSFDRKSKLEREQEERLKLEAKLDEALDNYAKKNIDRTAKVANQILKIEKSKYAGLLKMADEFTNGKVVDFKVTNPDSAIGLTGDPGSENSKAHKQWLDKLKEVNGAYSKELASMQKAYEEAMSKANNKAEKDAATNKFILDQLKLQERIYREIVKVNDEAIKQAEKELENTSLTTEQREDLLEAIKGYKEESISAQQSIKDTIQSRFDFEFELLDKAKEKAEKYSDSLDKLLGIANAVNSSSESKKGLLENIYESKLGQYATVRDELSKLIEEQSKFAEGSFEWNILNDRIKDVNESIHSLTIELLEANKAVLDNSLDMYKESSEKGILGGKTLDQFKDERDKWLTGITKELELEKLRLAAAELEDEQINKKLEMLDRQEKISKKDTEYLDKQMKVLELQNKLSNLDKERTVQTIARKDDGTWGWEYVADQTDYDKTKDDLNQAQKDLEEYKQTQRESYVSDLGSVIDKAKSGEYKSADELSNALQTLKEAYGSILGDIPEVEMNNIEDIVKAYEDYLLKNKDIVSKATDGSENAMFEKQLDLAAERFEKSFKDIASDIGKIIGDEIKEALRMANSPVANYGRSYIIENQNLEFPNVTDSNGLEEMLKSLPDVVDQAVKSK